MEDLDHESRTRSADAKDSPDAEPDARDARARLPLRVWWVSGLTIVLLSLLVWLLFTDVHRRNTQALEDFAGAQETLASALAGGLAARLETVRQDVLWAAGQLDQPGPLPPRMADLRPSLQVVQDDATPPQVGPGTVQFALPLDHRRSAHFALSLSSLRDGLRELDSPGHIRMLMLPPGGQAFQTLNGRLVPSDLLLATLRSPTRHVRIPPDLAAALRLPPRDALAGLAQIDAGAMGVWSVAVVATARRALDREAQASWRSILAVLLSAGLVLLMGLFLARAQRRELHSEQALALEAAHRRREGELERANRAATLGALAMGIAHEMATPLGIIANRAEQLSDVADQPDKVRRSAQVIGDQAMRMGRVVRGILGLVRGQSPSDARLSPATVAQHAADLVAHRFRAAHVHLRLQIQPHLPHVRGDQHLLEHALVNLLLNACDACPAGGRVELIVSVRSDGDAALFTVRDNGSGISEEAARHATEPFFTTKPAGKGSGLGLAIAQEILKGHRGSLHLEPRPGGGTIATATVPLSPPRSDAAAPPSRPAATDLDAPAPPATAAPSAQSTRSAQSARSERTSA